MDPPGDCACRFHGEELPAAVYNTYPTGTDAARQYRPGNSQNAYRGSYIYGTICAAWDQAPLTPWHSRCPLNSKWCEQDKNWCQEPWCYVGENCADAQASKVFGTTNYHRRRAQLAYSYAACRAPDCYTSFQRADAEIYIASSFPMAYSASEKSKRDAINQEYWYQSKGYRGGDGPGRRRSSDPLDPIPAQCPFETMQFSDNNRRRNRPPRSSTWPALISTGPGPYGRRRLMKWYTAHITCDQDYTGAGNPVPTPVPVPLPVPQVAPAPVPVPVPVPEPVPQVAPAPVPVPVPAPAPTPQIAPAPVPP